MSRMSDAEDELGRMFEAGEVSQDELIAALTELHRQNASRKPKPAYMERDFWLGLAILVTFVSGVYYAGGAVHAALQRTPEEIAAYEAKKARTEKEAAKKAAEEAKREQEIKVRDAQDKRRKYIDRTCMVDTNDTSYYLGLEIKAKLRDPASYEPIRATWIDQGDKVAVIQDYRARNGFGGMNVGRVAAVLNYSDCMVRALQYLD